MHFIRNYYVYLFLIAIIVTTGFLRFKDLGYTDYIDDEHSTFITSKIKQPLFEYFLSQRKGPLQNLVSHIPYLITRDFMNTFAQRLPYALLNLGAGLVLYYLLKIDTKSELTALLATTLFLINGFTVGFGRIVQYQNLNMFFSFLALLCFIIFGQTKKLRYSFLGTLSFSLSFYAHFDAIFVLLPISYICVAHLFDRTISSNDKAKFLFLNFLTLAITLLPFFIPYTLY